MKWIEAAVDVSREQIDAVTEQLTDLGVQGVSIEDEQDLREFLENNRQYWDYIDESLQQKFAGVCRIKYYVLDDADGRAMQAKIRAALPLPVRESVVDDADWAYTWKDNFRPIEIGERLLVLPEWEPDPENGRKVLRIDPGMAFGTGNHETTRMSLELLEGLDAEGKRVLDLGCGSGILGIGAKILGASTVTGCDIDPNSPIAARKNAELNGIDPDSYLVFAGNILADEGFQRRLGENYDIVLANIVADVVIPLTGFVKRFLKAGGFYICSGIIDNRAAETENAIKNAGLEIVKHLQMAEWHGYLCR